MDSIFAEESIASRRAARSETAKKERKRECKCWKYVNTNVRLNVKYTWQYLSATAREIHIIPHSTFNPMQIFSSSFDSVQQARSGLKAGNQGRIVYPAFSLPVTLPSARSLRTALNLHILKSEPESLKQAFLPVKNKTQMKKRIVSTASTKIINISFHNGYHFQVNHCYHFCIACT